MQISETGLNKGFTLLEIIIVLTIISVASTSFYLLLRQPAPEESLEDRIEYFREISLYTGSTYAFSKESINIYANSEWIKLEEFNSDYVSKYGLYPTLSRKNMSKGYNNILNFVAYANGKRNLRELSDLLKIPYPKILKLYKLLKKKKIVI